MATLLQKRNGDWYIRGRAGGGFCTWQVTSAGVTELEGRGYVLGDYLAPDLVGRLAQRGLIYTGGGGVEESPGVAVPYGKARETTQPEKSYGCLWAIIIFLFIAFFGSQNC